MYIIAEKRISLIILIKLCESWDNYLSKFQCELPDKDTQLMINVWNPYQAERNFQFSRNISYYATGTFRGVGVRDTAQDILAMIPFNLRRAKNKLNLLFTTISGWTLQSLLFPVRGLGTS